MRWKIRRGLTIMWLAICLSAIYFLILLIMNLSYDSEATDSDTREPAFIQNGRNKRFSKSAVSKTPFKQPSRLFQAIKIQNSNYGENQEISENITSVQELINKQKEEHQEMHDTKKDYRKVKNNYQISKDSTKDVIENRFNNDQNDIQVANENGMYQNLNDLNSLFEKPIGFARFVAMMPPAEERRVVTLAEAVPTPLKNKDVIEKYYKLRDTRVNAFDFEYLATGNGICKTNEDVMLVIFCLTKYYDVDTRDTIRNTWGKVAKTGRWPGYGGLVKGIKLVFLLGSHGDHKVKRAIIEDESSKSNDIVAGDFVDSYFNLTYKVMLGLKWTCEFCKQARYMVKVDQDMFLHVHNLVTYLSSHITSNNGEILGYSNPTPKVLRTGKWGVPWDIFPFTAFPGYTNGNCYVISGNAVSKIFKAAERLPFLYIEDAFLTGVCRRAMNISIVHHGGFTRWGDHPPRLCGFHNNYRIAATSTDDNKKRDLWRALQYRNVKNCYNMTTKRDKVRQKRT